MNNMGLYMSEIKEESGGRKHLYAICKASTKVDHHLAILVSFERILYKTFQFKLIFEFKFGSGTKYHYYMIIKM